MELLATFQFHFCISRVKVCPEQDLVLIPIKNEGGRTVIVIMVLNFDEKKSVFSIYLCCSSGPYDCAHI
jgi:hypothetical protein